MSILHDLLLEAATWRARLSNPAAIESSQAAIDAVSGFIAVEDRILALPDAAAELSQELTVALDPGGRRVNHAMMAGLILARSGARSAVEALLPAARHSDPWCATQARLNLSWLARTRASAELIRAEIEAGGALRSPALPLSLLVDALIHQRRSEDTELIASFIQGVAPEAERALALEAYVDHFPKEGAALAKVLGRSRQGPLAVTALGLDGVYGDEDAAAELREVCSRRDARWHTALRWVGRTARAESVPVLVDGLAHPDAAVRADVVTSLAWHGTPEAWRAVIAALDDPAREVGDQATSLIFDWIGDEAADIASAWQYDADGRLARASRDALAGVMKQSLDGLSPTQRYMRGQPLDAEALLDCLYIGILPAHSWYHWVSMTGAVRPYEPRKDVLYNFPALDELSVWLLGAS